MKSCALLFCQWNDSREPPAPLFLGVGSSQCGVAQEPRVAEAREKIGQILSLLRSQGEALDEGILARMRAAIAGPRSIGQHTTAGCVEVDDIIERRETVVVHVRRAVRDVAQRRRFESIFVSDVAGDCIQAIVGIADEGLAVRIKPCDMKRALDDRRALMSHELTEVETRVAMRAF